MTWRDEEWSADGDVEYHTTSHVELAEFYADATTIRDGNSIKATSAMAGNVTCLYGRFSDDRTCLIEVEAVGACITFSGVEVCNLARTDSTPSESGDSGGGWSLNYEAWGVNKGHSGGKGYFTTIEEVEDNLNVTILTP